ncbi:MAG: hypothetical protein ACPGYX_03845 [Oceanobacter sp.]
MATGAGLLGAALYQPVWVSAVNSNLDFALMLLCFLLLQIAKRPAWQVLLLGAVAGAVVY